MQFSIIVYMYLTYYNEVTLTNFGYLSLYAELFYL